ncbi:hypothetical protein RhiJN_01311 [Ceratobasidium sp. AG-Ba]|nr:hypothetical protein RhiJN_01311 [Ceratobasidium sp. AG-Ba]QRW02335.1 hypothetical protein RhiLY_01333 [Ceratobasidium sp. AG-Ba]
MLASLLCACPDLEALAVVLLRKEMQDSWCFSHLCAELEQKNVTLGSLASLTFIANFIPSVDERDEPVRSFFARHPGIKKIWFATSRSCKLPYDLGNIDGAFRSLVHFHGPGSMCVAIILSQAASQLQHLHIKNVHSNIEEVIAGGIVWSDWSSLHVLRRLTALRELIIELADDHAPEERNYLIKNLFVDTSTTLEYLKLQSGRRHIHAFNGSGVPVSRAPIHAKSSDSGSWGRDKHVSWHGGLGRLYACVRGYVSKTRVDIKLLSW